MYRYEVTSTVRGDIEGVVGRPVFYDEDGKFYINGDKRQIAFQYWDATAEADVSKTLDQICQDLYSTDFDAQSTETVMPEEVLKVKPQPSQHQVTLRIEGDTWNCPADTETTHYIALNDDYMIRGAEFQFVNGKAGDFVEVWVTDKDGVVYPAGTKLTKYVNKFCVYDHEPNTQAWVADLVDDDASDEVPSVFYLEFKYTNNQAAGSDAVIAVVNFWMYKKQDE